MPPKASSFHRLMACRCLLLYFFWFHTGKVVFGAEFTFCGYLHHSINKSHHHIEPGPGPCSLNVSINQAGLRIKARLIGNGPPICLEDIATTTPDGSSDVCITWKEHVGKLFITRGDVVKSYSTAMSTKRKCCQNFILTKSTSSNNSPLLSDIIYINGSHFSPVHIENASYLEFTGSEGACETPWSDCIKQKDKLTQLANQEQVKPNDARYAVLIVSGILEECNASISVGLESDLHNVLMKVDFPEDSKTFVTPNVKATVIKVNPRSNLEVVGTVYFSWVGPEDQRVIVAVQVKFPCQLHTSPKAVVTQFKNKTSFQGQERSPVSPNIIIRVRSSSIDDLTSPLTFQDMWERNSTLCGVLDSEQKVDPNGCNIQTGDNITCRCDRLGFFFAVTLESQDLFDFVPSGHPFKITTRTNHPTNINVATPVADISYDTSLESTTSISSSPGKNPTTGISDPSLMCHDLEQQLIFTQKNNSSYDSVKIVSTLMEQCDGHISDSNKVIFALHRALMGMKLEGENQSFSTQNLFAYVQEIKPETFTEIDFPNSALIQQTNISDLVLKAKIKLPSALLDNVKKQSNADKLRIIFTIYENTTLFLDQNNSTVLNNLVVGIKVVNVIIKNLTSPVIIEFQNVSLPNQSVGKCVFWDFKTGNTSSGDWSEDGCTTETEFHNITCKCDHLTPFAVLLKTVTVFSETEGSRSKTMKTQ